MKDCIFCKIIKKEVPAYIVYENEFVLAILAKDMEVYGHTLVIPKQHYKDIFDIETHVLKKIISVVKKLSIQYKKNISATGINIFNASGTDAQQSVFHFHIHILPRFSNDGLDTRPTNHTQQKYDKSLMLKKICGQNV
ncbi:MAG: HIT-like protein [candidate division CPR1 bacterium ADurb.Bin160]|jgi:histidine triad (HIT) family protein|uniref:HIT-like protein n=1 Tax=candidate division CPR1 bacterium ADurb.Bin160 TaxID=1852826 RepID=A0A1V5ZN08_9BACT|nr:MAG: HIT-like protein [candidate division CPR1 bacterium ADurb.Bin160]